MPSDGATFFSREELLGGLPARRASTVLFAIEARTAHLVARSRRAMAVQDTERTSANRERAFLEAFAGARELPLTPTIQDLDRYAPRWEDIAPQDADLRAAVARLLGRKYRFTAARVPRLREALGLDEAKTAAAHERLYGEPLERIYAPSLTASDRLRWTRSSLARRLEELPPFWTAYALALTETVGAGILALPIALAGIGPLAGIVFLLVAGLLNVLTIGGLVEAITRNGEMRYGAAYFGRLASALLGRGGSATITVALFVFNAVTLLAYLIAFAAPLEHATPLDATVWVAVLFLVNVLLLRRDLNATVASAVAIGAVNLVLICLIAAIALPSVDADNLTHTQLPFVGDDPATVGVLGLAFGVVILSYFGHTTCGNVARLILEREPSGKGLFRGSVAATATVIVIYAVTVLAIEGAVPSSELVGYDGTALEPLSDQVGSAVTVLGSIYVVLAVGLASIYVSLGLANQVREWLPGGAGRGFSGFAASDRGAFLLGAAPSLLVFVAVEWLLLVDRASFTDPLAVIGALAIPLLGGVFPMLLLAASRRRGELVPASWLRVLRGPVSMAAVALVFLAGLIVQGFVIWQRPIEWAAAAVVVCLAALVTWLAVRHGAFRPRAVIELRREPAGRGSFAVTLLGRPETVTVRIAANGTERSLDASGGTIDHFGALRAIAFDLPASRARELKVWVHGVTAEGDSEGIPATVQLASASGELERRTDGGSGATVLPIAGHASEVRILLQNP